MGWDPTAGTPSADLTTSGSGVDNDEMTYGVTHQNYAQVRGTTALSGKQYFEFTTFNDGSSSIRAFVGVADSSLAEGTANNAPGQQTNAATANLLVDNYLVYYDANSTNITSTVGAAVHGDILQVAFDASTGEIWFGRENTWDGDPAAGTGAAETLGGSGFTLICAVPFGQGNGVRGFFNPASQTYSPPTGFSAVEEDPPAGLGESDLFPGLLLDSYAVQTTHPGDADLSFDLLLDAAARNTTSPADGELFPHLFLDSDAVNVTSHADGDLFPSLLLDSVGRNATSRSDGDLFPSLLLDSEARTPLKLADGDLNLSIILDAAAEGLLIVRLNQPYNLNPGASLVQPYSTPLRASLVQPYSQLVSNSLAGLYSLLGPILSSLVQPYDEAVDVLSSLTSPYSLLSYDPVSRNLRQLYSMIDASSVVTAADVYVMIGSERVDIDSLDLVAEQNSHSWQCFFVCSDEPSFDLFTKSAAFTVYIGADTWSFVVDDFTIQRPELQFGSPIHRLQVVGLSPTSLLDKPNVTLITKTWETAILASAVADEVTGESVQWDATDWTIPANLLSVQQSAPIDIVRRLAEVVGAIVQTTPSGTIVVDRKWPVSVPDMTLTTADEVFTDDLDIISSQSSIQSLEIFNQYTLRDRSAESDRTASEFVADGRRSDQGTIRVYPNPLRVPEVLHTGPVDLALQYLGLVSRTEVEEVEFREGVAILRYPVFSLGSVSWRDTDLGALTSVVNETEIRSATAGYSLAAVTYTTRSYNWFVSYHSNRRVQFLVQ